jgi:hypothetical protein
VIPDTGCTKQQLQVVSAGCGGLLQLLAIKSVGASVGGDFATGGDTLSWLAWLDSRSVDSITMVENQFIFVGD